MKYIKSNNQAWRGLVLVALMAAMQMVQAVPAYRGWVTKTQPDGTTVTVRQCGDEFYHYWENEQRQQVQEDSLGYWQVVGNAPTPATVAERRASNPMYRSKMAAVDANGANGPARVGALNLAPRGLFILVNFSDKSFNASNTQAAMNDMMNAANYTYNGAVGSARQYFIDQSNGAYTPTFDVVGPVTLTKATSYYGSNVGGERGEDAYAGDMIIEACKLADTQFGVDFTRYDNDGDGKVDFVYVIYAGKGEADGGAASTIWPHNWNLTGARYYGNCTYTQSQCRIDGKYIDNYACSGELNGTTGRRAGIGTLCHEFSHVLGLPDYYDTEYGTNYDNEVTPGEWTLMDQGSYNGNGNCPPNYSIYDKFYMGWTTPTVLKTADNITLPDPSLAANYGVGYYINSNGSTLASATSSTAVQYYIENRQQTGWDTRLPGHGMLVWQVKYDRSAWTGNEPNNTAGSPRYTIVSAKGTAKVQNTNYDTYPGSGNKRSYTPFAAYPLTNITENTTAKTVSFLFMGGAAINNYVSLDADLEGVTPNTTLGTQITKASGFNRTFTAAECYYDLASENYLIELTIGGVDKTDMYVSRTGSTVTINIPSAALTGNVEIAFYNDKKAEVIVEADGATVTGAADCVEKETTFQCTITPASGYSLAQDDIEVLMGSTELVPGVGFTYVGTTFRVPNVQDDLYILAHVKADIDCDSPITVEYYRNLDNKSGKNLFDAIHTVAKVGYSALSYDGLWTAYRKTDVYPAGHPQAGQIWDMYGGCSFTYSSDQCGTYSSECDCYNREHSIPKSWFGGATSQAGADLFHLYPTDGKVNGVRSNYAFGEVSAASYSYNGSKLGTAKNITISNTILGASNQTASVMGTVFEPIDEYKGDFARSYMGAMIRWANGDYQTFTSGDGAKIFSGNDTEVGRYGLTAYGVALLMKWHRQDPVSEKEINRNDAIQETQGNRNPFIDYPDLAEYLWGNMAGHTLDIDALTPTFCSGSTSDPDPVPVVYIITWMADGSVHDTTHVVEGNTLLLPVGENPTACGNGKQFMGWTATADYQHTTVAPAYAAAGDVVDGDRTYYAVYATQSGGGQDTISYGWEAGDDASVWSISNFVNSNTAITAATGSKYGATNATTSAYIATKAKIASPVSISYRYSKVTTNTNSSSWKVQVSSNGSAWTDVDTKSASSATKGTWSSSGTIDLSSYSDVYVRIYYTGTTAIRTLDDVMLVAGSAPVYSEFTTECVAPVTTIDIPITGGIWHYVSFPVDVTDDKINYAGNGVWGTYNSTTRANGFSGWEHTNPAETPLRANMGYIFYGDVDGTLSIDIDPATLPQTDMQVSLTAYPSFSNDNADWNFVGNPYYAQYDIRNIDPDDTSLWLTLWDGVGYQTKNTNRHAYLLRPFEAFFLQKGTTDHLSFYADSRAAAPVRALRVNDEQFVEIAATVAGYTDHAYLVIDETAGLQYEAGQDVAKFMTATAPVQVYWVDNDEVACAVYARPEGDDIIRLGYSVPEESEVTISAQTMEQTYYLYDAMTGEMVDLRMGDYHFASQAGTYTQRITLRRIPTVSTGMSIDNEGVQRVQKVLREGQIVIVRNGLCYDLRGNRVE